MVLTTAVNNGIQKLFPYAERIKMYIFNSFITAC